MIGLGNNLPTNFIALELEEKNESILQNEVILLFPFWLGGHLFFFFFSCLNALARTSSTILYKTGESGHPWLISGLRGKFFSVLAIHMMLAVYFFLI